MEGNPADLTVYKDSGTNYQIHDHTYYGRGCKNSWGTDGLGGSQTPCADSDAGGRFLKTADNETLKNGTYYHFQAATSGTGGGMATTNTNSPDTFCPLGWQLPYNGTGGDYYDKSRSWRYLLNTYNITYNDGGAEQNTKIRSYPFSYVHAGRYYWFTGRLYLQDKEGYHWSSTIVNNTNSFNMTMWSSGIRIGTTADKSAGFPLRCVLEF